MIKTLGFKRRGARIDDAIKKAIAQVIGEQNQESQSPCAKHWKHAPIAPYRGTV